MQAIYVSTGQSLEKSDVLSGKLPLRRGLDAQRKSLGIRFRQRARLLRSSSVQNISTYQRCQPPRPCTKESNDA